jgi:signal transduction histidine kinase
MLLNQITQHVDRHLFAIIVSAPAGASGEASQSAASAACQSIVLLLASFAASWAGYRLAKAGLWICSFQIVVVAILIQWLCWTTLQVPGQLFSVIMAVLLGCASGMALKTIDEMRRLEEAQRLELRMRNQELVDSRMVLVKQDEVERRLLAADLHDQVLNDLRHVAKNFSAYVQHPETKTAVDVHNGLSKAMHDISEIMDNLSPQILEHFGLAAAIEDCLDKGAQKSGFEVSLQSTVDNELLARLSDVRQQLIYRLVQESITNICKHAKASVVNVTIDKEYDQLVFKVTDNGRGIDESKLSESSRGMIYMRLRADLIGAKIAWSRPKKCGTCVEIRISIPPEEPAPS